MTAINLRNAMSTVFEGDEPSLTQSEAEDMRQQLHRDWTISVDNQNISRVFKFRDFYETMAFVIDVSDIVHKEDHHPYFELSYNRCMIRYTTHTLRGLSTNDFICASKIDALVE